jgi:hypothetical protein
MLDRLLALFRDDSGSDQSMEDARRAVYGEPWEWERAHERPYDDYTGATGDIKQLKRERRHDEVEDLLLWCIDYAEAEARAENTIPESPPPAYYRHLAIVYRKDDRHADEVAILERYVQACEGGGGGPDGELLDRLDRARELAGELRG